MLKIHLKRCLFCLLTVLPIRNFACTSSQDVWLDLTVAIRQGQLVEFNCLYPQLNKQNFDPADHYENTPLHLAAKYNQVAMIKFLLAQGVNVNSKNALDQAALLLAIQANASDAAAYLIFHGADIEAADYAGRTMLFWAIDAHNAAITRLLLEKGANSRQVYNQTEVKYSALEYAHKKGFEDLVQELTQTTTGTK